MQTSLSKIRKDEKGFTLVELAVVMIIIGLLIGGILKGQELIINARVTSTASQLEAMSAAYNGFRDQYNALPGDMNNAAGPTGRLAACATFAACVNGNGNGVIDANVGAAIGANEGTRFFGQLLAGDFITGMDGSTTNGGFGTSNPTAPIGGGFTAGDTRAAGAPPGFTPGELRPAPHVVITGTTAAVAGAQGVLTPQQAANIDRRLDDGVPSTGSVIGQAGNGADCRQAVNVYGNLTANVCAIAYRI